MKRFFLNVALVTLLSACAVNITPVATGGSKADGIVELGFEHSHMQKPVIDEEAALKTAQARCAAWGYQKADKFGGHKRQCLAGSGLGGCSQFMVTIQYQCTN